ncbi:MAG: protein kinase domain-containing protein, partial [Aggregatilineales bacterium]
MADLFIGRTLGQYEITARLGQGGMADVYRAWHPSMQREVAVKILSLTITRDQLFAERFSREVQTIARLEHRHIVPVYEYGKTEDGVVYLAMRYLKGGTLADLIKAQGALPLTLVNQLLEQIAFALDYAHQKGVVHRDIKPSNVLLDEDQNAYLGDFGLARADDKNLAKTLTEAGAMIGTPIYLAPEVIQEQQSDSRSDLYSLGVLLYEMVTGRPPFTDESIYGLMQAHLKRQPPRPSALRPDLSQALERVLLKAIHKAPTLRYQSALELAQGFRLALQEAPTQPHPISLPSVLLRTGTFARRRPRLFGLGGLLVLLLIVTMLILPNLPLNRSNKANPTARTNAAASLPYADEQSRPEVDSPAALKNSPEAISRARQYLEGSFIGVMMCALSTDYHASLASALRTYADQLGVRLEIEDSQTDEFRQPIILRRFVARGAKAIVVCPLNYESIEPAIREAQSAGIATVVIGDQSYGLYSLNMNLTNEDIG